MNANTEKTCADKVKNAKESRLDDIRVMLDPQQTDCTLGDHGTMDTPIYCNGEGPISYGDTSSYRDGKTGELDLDWFLTDHMEDIREAMYESFFDYGLSWDYVEPDTFENQSEGYLRYQLSYGGPSEEIRFYISPSQYGYIMYRAEFWYLDWFDGASVDVTHDERAIMVFDHFNDCDSVRAAIENTNT